MNTIFCIAAGQKHTRKIPNKINKRHLYLNYGLLSIATNLEKMGLSPIQLQGNFDDPQQTLSECINLGLTDSGWPVLISIPSFYAVSWVREFVSLLRDIKPLQKIIVGGRWVVAGRGEHLNALLGGVDLVVDGIAEPFLASIISKFAPRGGAGRLLVTPERSPENYRLNYSLLHCREIYQPSIEVSRGCGLGCSFCQEKDERLQPLKPARAIIEELKSILIVDSHGAMRPYFEASIFAPNKKWTRALYECKSDAGMDFQWRTEARVDSISSGNIEVLAESGLRVIDLGLESASPIQLLRMGKTDNPHVYLSRASALLKTAHSLGIRTKVNILLFAGETSESISQTVDWLEKHRQYITGLSVGPVMVFGWRDSIQGYLAELGGYGASLAHEPHIAGVHELNLSPEIDKQAALEISRNISRSFMTAKRFYELKSFSYLPRSYSYSDFVSDVLSDRAEFSFDTSEL